MPVHGDSSRTAARKSCRCCDSTSNTMAASSTLRVKNPLVMPPTPKRVGLDLGVEPTGSFTPTVPENDAKRTIESAGPVAAATWHIPLTTAPAGPPNGPPIEKSGL
jgi:hypothetical protein